MGLVEHDGGAVLMMSELPPKRIISLITGQAGNLRMSGAQVEWCERCKWGWDGSCGHMIRLCLITPER